MSGCHPCRPADALGATAPCREASMGEGVGGGGEGGVAGAGCGRLVCVEKVAPLVFHTSLALTPDSVTMPRRGTQAQSFGASHLV